MIRLSLGAELGRPLSLLLLGAHSDDIEIGCGATVLRLLSEHPGARVHWVVFSADDTREDEARASAADFLADADQATVIIHRFRESYFPYVGDQIKDAFEELKRLVQPDVVFTHHRADDHQDHRMLAEFTWNTFRNQVVAEYEIPKYDGDLAQPNVFVPVDESVAQRKIDLLMRHFGSQRNKAWFRPETFAGLMAVRAIECGSPSGSAEAFHVRKLVW
jgi:LmbE family N-acetylglucosaminyl deacetylase